MKKPLLVSLLIFVSTALSQWTATIRVEDKVWRTGGQEWVTQMYADLSYYGSPIPPAPSYVYDWYWYDSNGIPRSWGGGSTAGLFHIEGDGLVGGTYPTYVIVQGYAMGRAFSVTSDVAIPGKSGAPSGAIYLYAKHEDGSLINGGVSTKHWMGNNWEMFQN